MCAIYEIQKNANNIVNLKFILKIKVFFLKQSLCKKNGWHITQDNISNFLKK